jgi:hypothetical protein
MWCAEGVLRGGDVLARAGDAAYDGERAAPADRQPRGRAPRPRPARGPRRGTPLCPLFFLQSLLI